MLHSKFNSVQCDIYDEKIANSGSEIVIKRYEMIDKIKDNFRIYYREISNTSDVLDICYNSFLFNSNCSKNECKNVFYDRLSENRNKDIKLGFTSVGPHRDNVRFLYNFREAKNFCSQGQCRSLSLSLRLASSHLLEENCQERIIYLIDDALSELDELRTENFFPLILDRGQIFIATPQGKSSFFKSFYFIPLI